MSEIVNLSRARKTRDRVAAKAAAAINRVTFGLPKGARSAAQTANAEAARRLSEHKREP